MVKDNFNLKVYNRSNGQRRLHSWISHIDKDMTCTKKSIEINDPCNTMNCIRKSYTLSQTFHLHASILLARTSNCMHCVLCPYWNLFLKEWTPHKLNGKHFSKIIKLGTDLINNYYKNVSSVFFVWRSTTKNCLSI
jgi:hypothetical protein